MGIHDHFELSADVRNASQYRQVARIEICEQGRVQGPRGVSSAAIRDTRWALPLRVSQLPQFL